MGSELLQTTWFWPLVFLIVAVYYGWVLFHYFRGALNIPLKGNGKSKASSGKSISLTWEELTMGFAVHRRLISDPMTSLDQEERALLGRSPFKELIKQPTTR